MLVHAELSFRHTSSDFGLAIFGLQNVLFPLPEVEPARSGMRLQRPVASRGQENLSQSQGQKQDERELKQKRAPGQEPMW